MAFLMSVSVSDELQLFAQEIQSFLFPNTLLLSYFCVYFDSIRGLHQNPLSLIKGSFLFA